MAIKSFPDSLPHFFLFLIPPSSPPVQHLFLSSPPRRPFHVDVLIVRPCLFALFTENFCLEPSAQINLSLSRSADVPNIPVRKYLAERIKLHSRESWCLWITDMTVSDQIHRILIVLYVCLLICVLFWKKHKSRLAFS